MRRLTKAQRSFMSDLTDDYTAGCVVECLPHEWRTAQSLAGRGICTIVSQRNEMGYFEAAATPAGLALSRKDQAG